MCSSLRLHVVACQQAEDASYLRLACAPDRYVRLNAHAGGTMVGTFSWPAEGCHLPRLEFVSLQLRLEAHRLQQQQQEQQVTDKGLLCQRAREGLQRKIGIRKDPFSVLLALRIPMPADNQPRNVKVRLLHDCMLAGNGRVSYLL